jgi:preprotein translocase subunit SecG
MLAGILVVLLAFFAIFMIVLVLLQRGKGGGLTGAFTGMGGQSAFGTKAGDTFTKITMWTAFLWIVLCAATVRYLKGGGDSKLEGDLGGERPVSTDGAGAAGGLLPAIPPGDGPPDENP